MDIEKITLELPNKMVVLTLTPFDTDINVDELTQIQMHNLVGEMMTSSVLMNRVGNLLAEFEAHESRAKLDYEIFYANMWEKMTKQLEVTEIDEKGKSKTKKPTREDIDQGIIRSVEYKQMQLRLINIKKELEFVRSLYWSVKDKCDKINKLTNNLKPEDFEREIVEETINTIQIKLKDKLLK